MYVMVCFSKYMIHHKGEKMGKLDRLFKRSYCLNEKDDTEYFDYVRDFCYTDEFASMEKNIQHGDISVVQHIYSVSYISYRLGKKLKFDKKAVTRGAFLHDLFYYDWHCPDPSHRLHGYHHPTTALRNARILSKKVGTSLSEVEENIIHRHMFPLTIIPPKYKESILVCFVDKYVAIKEIFISSFPKTKERFFSDVNKHK